MVRARRRTEPRGLFSFVIGEFPLAPTQIGFQTEVFDPVGIGSGIDRHLGDFHRGRGILPRKNLHIRRGGSCRGIGIGGGGVRDQPAHKGLGAWGGGVECAGIPDAGPVGAAQGGRLGCRKNLRRRSDPLVGPGGFLQVADRQHQSQTGVRLRHRHRLTLGGRPQRDAGQRQQAHGDDREQDHQAERHYEGESSEAASPGGLIGPE